MGNTDSSLNMRESSAVQSHSQNNTYDGRYNLVPSFRNVEYESVDDNFRSKYPTSEPIPNYLDLRTSFPNIRDVGAFPLNPIASVSYVLEYSLLKNELGPFPPSLLYINNHTNFYSSKNNLMSFESIFKSIRFNPLFTKDFT